MRGGTLGRRLCARFVALSAAALLALGGGAGCGAGEDESDAAAKQSQTPAPGTWPAPNGDAGNHRRVEGPIDAGSVSRLRVAWRVPLGALYSATPIVVDGVVYTQDLLSNVFAIDLDSGRELWRHAYESSDIGPNGVAVVDGQVLGATQTSVFALDAKTGEERWLTPIVQRPGDVVDMAPGYADGIVYVSTAVAGAGAVGTLWALDAETGEPKWRWEQVPADLWGAPATNSGGGMWHPPAFDGQGNLYASIANPLPFPGTADKPWGASRPGDNRWTNSLVKLDARTGRFLWGRQVLPHDLYDWDLQLPPILDRVQGRLVAIVGGKMGFVYAFDAEDGALLWKRSVGLHNGHDDDNLRAMRGNYRPRMPQKVLPGWWGGVETQMASDGETVYVPVNNFAITYRSQTDLDVPDPMEGSGEMVAIDVATGRVRWTRRLPHTPYGAASISSDLVFTTTYDGTVWALRRDNGKIVWTARLPAGTNAPLAIAGDTLIAAASVVVAEGDQQQLVAYRLGGVEGG